MVLEKTINELSELLRNNLKETQVSLPIGSGAYQNGGKRIEYGIFLMIRELDDFEDIGMEAEK
jgi:hypothetical protein